MYFDDSGGVYNLDIVLAKDLSNIYSGKIKIRFFNITNLYLNDVGNRFTQFEDLYIEKNLDGWDGVKYNLKQIDEKSILFDFLTLNYWKSIFLFLINNFLFNLRYFNEKFNA
ncbi:hypothetical protein [Acinetobacter calcoaceticus]|uniref:hypothetical protein n=1 Tax=Acinetobacter calcoaceticus TaxID=471 RepID=UPI00030286DA|nr:hypothetical protein [Acinetobacter calcoaceticus]KJH65002.1 hypothetical protein UF12_01875 [Acinetobacter calcoaceticus]